MVSIALTYIVTEQKCDKMKSVIMWPFMKSSYWHQKPLKNCLRDLFFLKLWLIIVVGIFFFTCIVEEKEEEEKGA